MLFYTPKLYEMILYPTLGGLFAWGIAYNFPSPTTELFAAAMYINCAFVASFYLYRDACQYIDGMKGNSPTLQQIVPTKTYLDMNKADAGGSVYSQSAISIKVNCVKNFNQTLIDQKQGGLEIDMTEGFWVVKRPEAEESNWVKAGGAGRADFVDMIARGVAWKAYKRVGGKQKPAPDQWRKIQQLAQGYPLPTWEQLPKQ